MFLRIRTFFIAGLLTFFEVDLKKLVALSTMSQIRFCIFVIIIIYFINSFNHIIAHAFFKSCLFICVGVQIYNSLGSQEFRSIKNLNYFHKLIFVIRIISLCGLLYLRGLFSKDLILVRIFSSNLIILLYFLFFIRVTITYFYRLTLLKRLMGERSLYLRLLSLFLIIIFPFVLSSGLIFFILNIMVRFLWAES